MDAANFAFDHPRGTVYGWFTDRGLRELRLPTPANRRRHVHVLHSSANDARVWALAAAMERFFKGLREDFGDIELDLEGRTPFRQAVWTAARDVPWGRASTYGALSERIGKGKGAARAVGQALGANPLPLVVPCHRFVGASGALVGFGSGLDWKVELLRLEGVELAAGQ